MLYYTYLVIGAMAAIQYGSGQIHTRSFCTGITMPESRLCDGNLPIIEITEVSQYEFTGDEYPGRPCVYSDSDCGKPISHTTQLYRDILTHCDGQRTCGGFYITSLAVCSRRFGDYITIRFQCRRDETATTILSPTRIRASSPTPQKATTPPNTTPPSVTTGSHVNPPTSSGVTGAESSDRITSGDPRRNNIVTSLGVGVAAAFVVGVGFGAATVVVLIRRKRGQRPDKANIRKGGGTEAGEAKDEVVYYNVAPTLISGEAAYSNVDIPRAPGREVPSDVHSKKESDKKTSSDVVPYTNLQNATHTQVASIGLPAKVSDTDGQYADLTGLPAKTPTQTGNTLI